MATDQLNQNLYLPPEQLTANEANEKARPAEKAEDRQRRVKAMADSILANGQELPVLVIEKEDDGVVTYEYIDGGCRVEAIAAINEHSENGSRKEVWCSLVDPGDDLFRKALTANLHRTQNSLLDMAFIVQEAFERNGWKGKGAGQKVAEYLGILPSRVSEYQKLLSAPKEVKERIESGEIATLDAALRLMGVPEDKRGEVAARAAELAEEEDKAKKKRERKHDPTPNVPLYNPAKDKANKPRVGAKHVAQAAREKGVDSASPKAKSEIVEFFEAVSAAAYPPAAADFAEYFCGPWMKGEGTDRKARELFDRAVGVKAAKAAKADKADKAVKPKVAKKAAPKKKK